MWTIIVILLVLALVGALPTWPHSVNWGPAPSGALAVVLLIIVLLFLAGKI